MKRHFLASCAVHVEYRGAGETRVFLKQTKRLSILVKRSQEAGVLFSSETDHAQLCDHDRPTENRCDRQKSENNFSCNRRVIERKQQTATGSYDFRNEHSRVTAISNNSVLQKRHRSFRGRDAALRRPDSAACCLYLDFTEMFLGKLGRFFAAMMNAIPIATRKNEKNWPRVNGPINSASGSRKFSIMIRKTA